MKQYINNFTNLILKIINDKFGHIHTHIVPNVVKKSLEILLKKSSNKNYEEINKKIEIREINRSKGYMKQLCGR